ncbi:HRDC-like protein [Phlyctochytrium arcticum]|nr:HRDC-like protein [Phlyctochytrium arcticum]
MEVVELRSAHLSNAEVLHFLNDVATEQQNGTQQVYNLIDPNLITLADLRLVEEDVKRYLNNTPSVAQTSEMIALFNDRIQVYDLTKAENLMLLNNRPNSVAELNPMVEDIDDRLTPEQQEELINILHEILPYTEPEREGAGEEAEAEADPME